jgi:Ca2+/Na+ antiporter
LFLDNWHLQAGAAGVIIGSILTLLAFIPLIVGLIKHQVFSKEKFLQHHVYPFIFFFCAFGCFMFLPNRLPGQYPIYERFSPVVLLSLIIWGSVWIRDINFTWLKPYVIAVTTLYSLLWFEYIYTFNQENKGFDAAFFQEAGYPSRSAGLIYDFVYRGKPVYIHFPNYFFVWKNGLAATKMIDFRFGVVRRGELGNRIPQYFEWIGADGRFNPEYHNTIEFLLMRGEPVAVIPNQEQYQLKNSKGPWKLYSNSRLVKTQTIDTTKGHRF